VETIYYGHVPLARDRRTSEGCLGLVLRATRGNRNNIPYTNIEVKKTHNIDKFRVILYIYINLITIRGAYKKEAFI
jgi:hypothetical protein